MRLRFPRVFRPIRRLVAALQGVRNELRGLVIAVLELTRAQQDLAPAKERLDNLELSRHQFEAQCEGLLLKAEGKFKAANNAEARERANRKSYEHLVDPLDEIGIEPETAGRHPDSGNDAAPSEEERVSAMRLGVAVSGKALAQKRKFGVR